MNFKELVNGIEYVKKQGDFTINIDGLQCDSRCNCKDKVFFCLKGQVSDGHDYIEQAVKKGTAGLIVEKWPSIKKSLPVLQVTDSRNTMAVCANNYYEYPSKSLNLIGITGTNGKTTASFLINQIFKKSNRKGGLIGTVKCLAGFKEIPIDRTTPESVDLQRIFNQMVCEGVTDCVMEVSSHAVAMKRINGTTFSVMVFTNLSHDHLDFHGTVESYFQAKRKLFGVPGQIDVVNIDDFYGRQIAELGKQVVTFAIDSAADVMAKNIRITNQGASFKLVLPNEKTWIDSRLSGKFNVYNLLAAAAAAKAAGFDTAVIKAGLESLNAVPGRLQFIQRKPFNVIVDYAHTPDGIENLLQTVKGFTKGRVITVFGCGGDRDRGKRPKMGSIASRLSDCVIVTSDNPRREEPDAIIREITRGMPENSFDVHNDRKEAIGKAIDIANQDDSVVIAGKGHETFQEIHGEMHPFNDVEVAKQFLAG